MAKPLDWEETKAFYGLDDAEMLGDIAVAFNKMRIRHPRIKEVAQKFHAARITKRKDPNGAKRYVEFFAESHTGKSTAVTTYLEDVVAPELIAKGLFPQDMPRAEVARKQNRVIHVTLRERATRATLYGDILQRLGDERAYEGSIPDQRTRLYDYLADDEVELLVIDEIQHLSVSIVKEVKGSKERSLVSQGTAVSDALKSMLIEGMVPIAFVGVPEAKHHFSLDTQLINREFAKVDFSPIKWTVAAERDLFINYCTETGVLIEDHGLLPEISDLVSGGIPAQLWAATQGRIGLVSRLCEMAVYHARERGARRVEVEDLEWAVDVRGIPNGFSSYNPFTHGVRQVEEIEA